MNINEGSYSLLIKLDCRFRSLQLEVSGEGGGKPTAADRHLLLSPQEEAPQRSDPSRPVSPSLSRDAFPCPLVLGGGGKLHGHLGRQSQIAAIAGVWILVGLIGVSLLIWCYLLQMVAVSRAKTWVDYVSVSSFIIILGSTTGYIFTLRVAYFIPYGIVTRKRNQRLIVPKDKAKCEK